MRVVELIPEIDPVKMARSASGLDRSSGTHVTEVIRHLENTVTKPGQRKPVSALSPDEIKRMGAYTSMGWAWEIVLRDALARVWTQGNLPIVTTGEVEHDGLVGTPDGLNTEDMAVEEFKATWRSSRRSRDLETEFWSWMVQMKAYCYALGLDAATLRTFFVNGDYRKSGPQMKKWRVYFDGKELKDNWTMLKRGAESLEKSR